ncbi:transcriptional regulator, TetR family [Streptomyces sp. 3214.6]|nr:transcriptional regulator, TetR family [Streptomyces sp. 3214.6]
MAKALWAGAGGEREGNDGAVSQSDAPRGPVGRPPVTSRTQILSAARQLIDRDGWEKLTIRRLAAEIGIGATTLYRHVQDKEDLLFLLIQEYADQIPHPGLPGEPRDRIVAALTAVHDALADRPWAAEVLTTRSARSSSAPTPPLGGRAANVPPTVTPCPASSTPRRCRAWPHSATGGRRRTRGTTIRRGCGPSSTDCWHRPRRRAIVPRSLIAGHRRASHVARRASGAGRRASGVGRHEGLIGPGRSAQNETARAPCQSPARAEDRGCATGEPSWTSRVRASWRRASGSRSAHSAA